MDFSALGGITVLIVAALWILVYIPAWTQNAQRRDEERTVVREVRRVEVAARRAPRSAQLNIAERVHQLTLKVRVGGTLAFTGFFSTVLGLALIAIPFAWIATPVGLLFFAVGVRTMRRANFERHALASQSLRRRSSQTNHVIGWSAASVAAEPQASQLVEEQPIVDPRAWTPNKLPAPINMMHVGEIEQVTLAEVRPIEDAKQNVLEAEKLDEILRRRRAIG